MFQDAGSAQRIRERAITEVITSHRDVCVWAGGAGREASSIACCRGRAAHARSALLGAPSQQRGGHGHHLARARPGPPTCCPCTRRCHARGAAQAAINTLLTHPNIVNTYAYDMRPVEQSDVPHTVLWKLHIIQVRCVAGGRLHTQQPLAAHVAPCWGLLA